MATGPDHSVPQSQIGVGPEELVTGDFVRPQVARRRAVGECHGSPNCELTRSLGKIERIWVRTVLREIKQVTYFAQRLDYFAGDHQPLNASGQEEGKTWFVILPTGQPLSAP